MAALREVSRGYVHALVRHCSRKVKVLQRAIALSWYEGRFTASLPEDQRAVSVPENVPRRGVIGVPQRSVTPSVGSTLDASAGQREDRGFWAAEDPSQYFRQT